MIISGCPANNPNTIPEMQVDINVSDIPILCSVFLAKIHIIKYIFPPKLVRLVFITE